MNDYIFSSSAREDLLELWSSRALEDIEAADRLRDVIHEGILKLVALPGMGHRRDDLADESLRVWNVRGHLIIYRWQTAPLEIVRIISGSRDIAALFGEPET